MASHRCSEVHCQVSFQNSETIDDDVSELDQQNGNTSSEINSGLDDLDLNSSESEIATDEELSATVESSRDPAEDPEPSTSTNLRERVFLGNFGSQQEHNNYYCIIYNIKYKKYKKKNIKYREHSVSGT